MKRDFYHKAQNFLLWKNIEPYDVYTADEAFITGTPFCMLPVTSLNGLKVGNGQVGDLFTKIIRLWSEKLDVNIISQIQQWDSERSKEHNNDAPTPYNFGKK